MDRRRDEEEKRGGGGKGRGRSRTEEEDDGSRGYSCAGSFVLGWEFSWCDVIDFSRVS